MVHKYVVEAKDPANAGLAAAYETYLNSPDMVALADKALADASQRLVHLAATDWPGYISALEGK